MLDILIVILLLIIFSLIIVYLVKQKKKGVKCIGCPYAKSCSSIKKKNCNSNN